MMKREEYIQKVTALIKNKAARNDVKKELEAHIDDRTQYYLDAGYDEEVSVSRAVEMMGNPEEVAESLERLHNNTLWIRLCVVSLCVFLCGLIYADCNLTGFSYINLVDFSETDVTVSSISVITFCAAVASFYFALKAKSITVLRTYGILAVLSPLLSLWALRPAGYQFFSIFTDFPSAIKNGTGIFGCEVFYPFVSTFLETDEAGVFGSLLANFVFWTLIFFVVAFTALPIAMGSLSLVYAGKLKREANCSKYKKSLKKFTTVMVAVCAITVFGTGAEIVHNEVLFIQFQQEYNAHKDEYYQKAKEEFDSITLPMSKEVAVALQKKNDEYDQYYKMELSGYTVLQVYVNAQEIELLDYEKDGIYEAKKFSNVIDCERGVKNEDIQNLKIGSSIEELYEVADFSNFMSYLMRKTGDETYIEIRIAVENDGEYWDEYWLEYTNGELVSSTAQK